MCCSRRPSVMRIDDHDHVDVVVYGDEYFLIILDNKFSTVINEFLNEGAQTKEDFLTGSDFCWGYVRAKFAQRARLAFRAVRRLMDDDCDCSGFSRTKNAWTTVISVGGGPGNDLFGAMVGLELQKAGGENEINSEVEQEGALVGGPLCSGTTARSSRPRPFISSSDTEYVLLDWSPAWREVVDRLGDTVNREISYEVCDVRDPEPGAWWTDLLGRVNGREEEEKRPSFLFLFSFVLLESHLGTSTTSAETESKNSLPNLGLLGYWLDYFATAHQKEQRSSGAAATFLILDAGQKKLSKEEFRNLNVRGGKEESDVENAEQDLSDMLQSSLKVVYDLVRKLYGPDQYTCRAFRVDEANVALVLQTGVGSR